MGILDDVVVNVKSAAEFVGVKAGQIVDISKLRINISELNSEINKRYIDLGRAVYDAHKNGEALETSAGDVVEEIDSLYAQLNSVMAEINTLQNKVICNVCGKQCSSESAYCSYCGAKLVKPEPVSVSEEPVAEEVAEAEAEEAAEEKTEE